MRLMILIVLFCIMGAEKQNSFKKDQASILYKSERVLMKQKGSVFLKNRKETAAYLNQVFNDPWFNNNFKIQKPQLIKSDKPDWAYSVIGTGIRKIAVPDTGLWNWCVLHEIAHHIVPHGNHGKNFAHIELLLIEHFLNKEAAHNLRISFQENGVKF